MIRTIDKYLFKEITIPLLVGLGLFFIIIAFGQLMKISDSVTGIGITSGELFEALAYSIPPMLGILIPVSMLFATLFAVGRMAADSEIVAWCASGGSPFALYRMPLILGTVLMTVCMIATTLGEPWGVKGLRELMARSAQRALAQGTNPGQFTEWVSGVVFYAEARDGDRLQKVFFTDRRDSAQAIAVSAKEGRVLQGASANEILFELKDGNIWIQDQVAGRQRMLKFGETVYRLNVGNLVGNKARTLQAVQGKTLSELQAVIEDPAQKKRHALHRIILHRKFALPIATIIFALLAVPLGCRREPGSRARSFLVSALIVGGYYYIGRAAELQARHADFPVLLAPWLANLMGLAALLVLSWRFRRRAT
jgi:LPS export ABC transporter permease LptF